MVHRSSGVVADPVEVPFTGKRGSCWQLLDSSLSRCRKRRKKSIYFESPLSLELVPSFFFLLNLSSYISLQETDDCSQSR